MSRAIPVLPEPRSQEAHEHVKRLRDELYRVRAENPGSGYELDAFVRYMHESALLGLSPTALPQYSPVESDRFFARVVEGPDRHRYWSNNNLVFPLNNGRSQNPRRWWWQHEHDVELTLYDDVTPTCGDRRCIAPWHCQVGRQAARLRYSDEHMLGGLQVLAMRLGHGPSESEWAASGRKPTASNFGLRFGSWTKAIRAAGLTPHGRGRKHA